MCDDEKWQGVYRWKHNESQHGAQFMCSSALECLQCVKCLHRSNHVDVDEHVDAAACALRLAFGRGDRDVELEGLRKDEAQPSAEDLGLGEAVVVL